MYSHLKKSARTLITMFWITFLYQSDIKELQYCSPEVRNRLSLVREINNTNVFALFLFDFPVCRIVPAQHS